MRVRGKGPFEQPDYINRLAGKAGKADDAAAAGGSVEKRPDVEPNPFAKKLEDASRAQDRRALDALLGEITEEGRRLAGQPTIAALEKFRALVKRFLDASVPGAWKMKTARSSPQAPQQKLYLVVEQVDARLAELTELVVSGQKDALKILATLDSLRGILMDLYS